MCLTYKLCSVLNKGYYCGPSADCCFLNASREGEDESASMVVGFSEKIVLFTLH